MAIAALHELGSPKRSKTIRWWQLPHPQRSLRIAALAKVTIVKLVSPKGGRARSADVRRITGEQPRRVAAYDFGNRVEFVPHWIEDLARRVRSAESAKRSLAVARALAKDDTLLDTFASILELGTVTVLDEWMKDNKTGADTRSAATVFIDETYARLCPAKTPTERAGVREKRARARLAAATEKRDAAQRLVDKWTKVVARYDRKAATS